MHRFAGFTIGVCLCTSSVAKADIPADRTPTAEDVATDIEFAALVEKGDRARAARRYVEAAKAYEAALRKQRDPIIVGRYGLVLMKLGQLDKAAEKLHAALERGQGASAQERREVAEAFDKARALTTWVNVPISHMGANISYDGGPLGVTSTFFWMFSMAGEHTLRATLDGYEDAEVTFTAKPGEEITVPLKLVPLPLPELPKPQSEGEDVLRKRMHPPYFRTSNVWGDPDYSPKEDPTYDEPKVTKLVEKKSGPRFSVSGGVVSVFGVASWNPAVGGVVGVGLRPHENISFGLEGRAAWLTTGVGGGQISAMTVGGIVSACGHLKWFFGCALGYVGTINVTPSEQSYEDKAFSFVNPGVGGRVGADIRVASSFVVRPSVEVLGLTSGTKLVANNKVLAEQPPLLLAGQVFGGWEF